MGHSLGPRPLALASALALALAGCGGSSSQSPPSGSSSGGASSSSGGETSGSSGGIAATHPALPQVDDNGGGIITAIEIVTVTFEASLYSNVTSPSPTQLIADLQSFDDAITQSAWWDTVRAGYCEPIGSTSCVGRGTTLPAAQGHVAIATAPAASYTDSANGNPATLKTYIGGLLSAGTLPAPTANTLYVFYFPSSTTIVSDGATSCVDIGGYHASVTYQGADVPYAVVPVCDPEATSQGTPELSHEQTATFAASHEIVESATDPHVGETAPSNDQTEHLGFYLTDSASQAWNLVLGGGEIADLCVDQVGVGEDRWTQGSWTVQRVWNNLSAAASHDPCVPIPSGEVYFNTAPPKADEEIELDALGQSTSYTATGFADGTIDPWTVEVVDLGQTSTGQVSALSTSPSKTTASNGSQIPVTITLESALTSQITGDPPFEPFVIVSIGAGTTYHLWPGIVYGSQ